MLLVLLVACSNYSPKADAAADTSRFDADTADTGNDGDVASATHWVARGAVALVGAAPTDASAAIDIVDADGEAAGTVTCTGDFETAAVTAEAPPDDELYVWWDGAVAAAPRCPAGPRALAFGLGPLLPDIVAQLGRFDLDRHEGAIYTAWLSADDAAPVAWGAAYTSAAADEDTGAPPDGAYSLVALYAIAL